MYYKNELFFVVRPTDGLISLQAAGAKYIHKNSDRFRVQIDDDVVNFAKEGKTVFSKFAKSLDKNILPKDEVVLVDSRDNFLAYGRSYLSHEEINSFEKGVAIKNRL